MKRMIAVILLGGMMALAASSEHLVADEKSTNKASSQVVLMSKTGRQIRFTKSEHSALPKAVQEAVLKVKSQSGDHPHAGTVYYKNGEMTAGSRYITTGRIVVKLAAGSQIDMEALGMKYGLVLEKRFGAKKRTIIFINDSSLDDVTVSNSLQHEESVLSVEPDWVMPLGLY